MKNSIFRVLRLIFYKKTLFIIWGIIFNVYEKCFGYPYLKSTFRKKVGYRLNLKAPKSFNEKINWKKINDRNPLLPIVADKYLVRDYLRDVLGKETAEIILVPLLYVTNKSETIPFDDLPEEYIIKANHRSGSNIIIEKGTYINRKQIIRYCNDLLNKPYALLKHEWAYQNIDRKIIIEKLMRDNAGKLPKDYKFNMIHGKCELIQVVHDRFTNVTKSFYTKEWIPVEIRREGKQGPIQNKPPINLSEMLRIAQRLSEPFDYIRIDLYTIENMLYFGEMTHYPLSGLGPFLPNSFDFVLGAKWATKPYYWKE